MGCKVRAAAASCLDAELGEKHPRSHQGLPPAQGTAARVEEAAFAPAPPQDTQVSAHRKYILAEIKQLIAKASPRIHRPRIPPDIAAPPPLPDPAGATGRESFWAAPSLAPPPSSQALAGLQRAAPAPHQAAPPAPQLPALAPGLGFPTFSPVHPGPAARLVPWAGLAPSCNPRLAMPVPAAALAVATPTSPHGQSPTAPRCPTCTCATNAAAAGDGAGPSVAHARDSIDSHYRVNRA